MSPETQRRIWEEIVKYRGLLTAEETWLQAQDKSVARDEGFRRINYWRVIYKNAEQQLKEIERVSSR